MGETARDSISLDVAQAVDAALREAGGGRMAGARVAYEFGRQAYVVQFVRGSWLCAATVDVATGEVVSIQDEGLPPADTGLHGVEDEPATVWPDFNTVHDLAPTLKNPGTAYVATDAGVGVVRLSHGFDWNLIVEDHHLTGFGATRHVAAAPGGPVATTADGRVFRMDAVGRLRWETRLPGCPHALDVAGARVLIATNAGAVELDVRTGDFLGLTGGPVRAAAYLPNGNRVLAGFRGELAVLTPEAEILWSMDQGEFPEKLWTHGDRVCLTGEGGVKEIMVGEGVVARWSVPAVETVEDAVVVDGSVFTCSGGTRLDRHGYATAAYHGRLESFTDPEAICVLEAGGQPWLLAGHRDGRLSALPV